MLATNFTDLKNHFKNYCDIVNKNSETLIITRAKKNESLVLMSLNEYNNLMENVKIFKNHKYIMELCTAIEEIKQGKGIQKTLDELEQMQDEHSVCA